MSDAPAEKTPAELELEDNLRSIRGLRENEDGVESTDATEPVQSDED